ncbi:MAG: tol-pal system protein YbgF [Betaproteobacteria bacterium]
MALVSAYAQQTPANTGATQTKPAPAGVDTRNPGVIQLLNQVEGLQAEINKLHGQIEVLGNGLENSQKRQRDMYLDLDTRLRRIEQQGGGAGSPRAEGPPQQQKPEGPPQPRAEGPPQQRADAASKSDVSATTSPELDTRLKRLEQQAGGDSAKSRDAPSDVESRIKRLEQLVAIQAMQSGQQSGGTPPAANAAVATATPPGAAVNTPTSPTRPTPPMPPTATANAATSPNADAGPVRKAYDSGLAAYRGGDYQGAIASFDGIVKRYPRDALAPNAQYWIGDAWFNLRDFRSAVAAQQALVNNYPDSPKIPDALLNLSSAYAALGESANARKSLEDLIARFPQSDAAEKGRQRLARLK